MLPSSNHNSRLLFYLIGKNCSILASSFALFTLRAIAAPENFNPQLTSPPPVEIEPELVSESPPQIEETPEKIESSEPLAKPKRQNVTRSLPQPKLPAENALSSGTADVELQEDFSPENIASDSGFKVTNTDFDFKLDFDNFGQRNQIIQEIIAFNINALDFLLNTGTNSYQQDTFEDVNNIPLYLTWNTKFKKIDLSLTGGVDFFNRLATTPTFTLKSSSPLFSSISDDGKLKSLFVLSGQVQHQAYKFNAETLENEINFWRFTPSIYWQIRPGLSLFTMGQYGIFNDSNRELQSFSRLEQKLGSFHLAANLFTWSFREDLGAESGYFSPLDFLVYNAEFGWSGTMFDEILDCQLSIALGKQSVASIIDNAWTYKALCAAQLFTNLTFDFGYTFSNVRDSETQETNYNNQSVTGTLNFQF